MVTEFFLNILFNIASGFFNLLPDISWDVNSNAMEYFLGIVRVVGYLIPLDTVFTIISIIVSLTLFKVVVSLLRTLWDVLPLV